MKQLGAGPDVIEAARKQQQQAEGEEFELFEDTRLSVEVFSRMTTQWHRSEGKPMGLIYASLDRVTRRLKVPPEQEDQVFDDVQVMESELLRVLAERGS